VSRADSHIGGRRLRAARRGALTARLALAGLQTEPPGGPERWQRTNYAGRTVSLLAGPALVAGAAFGAPLSWRGRAALAIAVTGAGAIGGYDDLGARRGIEAKGLRGHLGALSRGQFTSGTVKIVGLSAVGLTAATLVSGNPTDALIGGAVVAGFANLANLLDLRPGRCLKFGLLHAPILVLPGAGGDALAAPLGAAAALLPDDLAAHTMLGDTGANALGAALGVAALVAYGRLGRLAHLVGLTALTLASERVSFSAVIAEHPLLRRLDEFGRASAST
jgi:UDP-N-acetylmuramyl pentapeptide phosphotransferase/UDP-N-acetylglucosamine-1-phosphate transferase